MSALRIDTEASAWAARRWAEWGDQINRVQLEARRDADRLQLEHESAWAVWRLASAASGLWSVGGLLRLVVEQVEAADAGRPPPYPGLSAAELLQVASGVARSTGSCPAGTPFSGPIGERGGTYSGELRSPYDIGGADAVAVGRQLLMRALADTDSAERIREDEFELVQLGETRFLVVLPGVIDLSSPGRGLSPEHRSVRDLDQHALPSSRNADVADNAYAQMVWSALLERGVPAGSQLVIVGHSFGADTALDLAADPGFNGGDDGFDVTHVVASGYNSGPQLEHVPSGTQVLVLQNRHDAVIIAEAVGEAHVTDLGYAVGDVGEGLLDFDLPKVVSGAARAAWHELGAEVAAVSHVASRADDVLGGDVAALVTLEQGIDTPTPSQVVAVFDGGSEGFGHHQDNYVEFLGEASDPAVTAFLGSLGGAAAIGTAIAVDVSVPDPDERRHASDDDS